jgi:hypothetical protein
MAEKVPVGQMASVIMDCLEEYADMATSDMKEAVKKSAKTVKNEIAANAPKKSGAYAKSWTTKTTKENADSLEITVHSKNRYQLAHLLENGHAKRGGGRVAAQVHIAPAEQKGIEQLEREIERSLQNG